MVIFFDIDGTLVDEKTQILPRSAAEAIAELAQQGHFPVVNTGRPYTHIDPRVRDLPFSGWVSGGGAEVCIQGRWLKREYAPAEIIPFLVDRVRNNHLQVMFEAVGGYYLDGANSLHPEIQTQSAFMKRIGNFVRSVEQGVKDPVVKFCTFDAPGGDQQEMIADAAPWFEAIDRRGMQEFVLKGKSKAKGMEMILQHLGYTKADAMAFGDSGNDLPMLQAAGVGIAMGNAVKEAKNAADYVTKSVLEDGIAHGLKHFGLIKGERI